MAGFDLTNMAGKQYGGFSRHNCAIRRLILRDSGPLPQTAISHTQHSLVCIMFFSLHYSCHPVIHYTILAVLGSGAPRFVPPSEIKKSIGYMKCTAYTYFNPLILMFISTRPSIIANSVLHAAKNPYVIYVGLL